MAPDCRSPRLASYLSLSHCRCEQRPQKHAQAGVQGMGTRRRASSSTVCFAQLASARHHHRRQHRDGQQRASSGATTMSAKLGCASTMIAPLVVAERSVRSTATDRLLHLA